MPTHSPLDATNYKNAHKTRGRNTTLNSARNEFMCHLYYYYNSLQKITYAKTVAKIASALFLKESSTLIYLQKHNSKILELRTQNLKIEDLKKKYPWFNFK
jgi:hypothetical protein